MKDKVLKVAIGFSLIILIILFLFFDLKNPFTAGFIVYFVILTVVLVFISIRRIDLESRVKKIKTGNNIFYTVLQNYETDAFGPIFSSDMEKEDFYTKIRGISKREEDRYKKQEKLRDCLKHVENSSEEVANEFMGEAVTILRYLIRYHVYEVKEEWSQVKNSFFQKQEAFETNKIINKAESLFENAHSKQDKAKAFLNAKAFIQQNIDERPQNINREKIDNYIAELNARFGHFATEPNVDTEKVDEEQDTEQKENF